jgi:hypothetical protein
MRLASEATSTFDHITLVDLLLTEECHGCLVGVTLLNCDVPDVNLLYAARTQPLLTHWKALSSSVILIPGVIPPSDRRSNESPGRGHGQRRILNVHCGSPTDKVPRELCWQMTHSIADWRSGLLHFMLAVGGLVAGARYLSFRVGSQDVQQQP